MTKTKTSKGEISETMQGKLEGEKTIYQQIAKAIEDDILRDVLNVHNPVPSTNQLAKFYVINPATAAKGINTLVDEGILYKKRGLGMYVSEGAKKLIMGKRKQSFYNDLLTNVLLEAKYLNISKEELAEMILNSKETNNELGGEY